MTDTYNGDMIIPEGWEFNQIIYDPSKNFSKPFMIFFENKKLNSDLCVFGETPEQGIKSAVIEMRKYNEKI